MTPRYCRIYPAFRFIDFRQKNGRRYTLFINSNAAIGRVGTGVLGSGRAQAIAAMEACDRIFE